MKVEVEVRGERRLTTTNEIEGITRLLGPLGCQRIAAHPDQPMWLTSLDIDADTQTDAAAMVLKAMRGVGEEYPGSVEDVHVSWPEVGA